MTERGGRFGEEEVTEGGWLTARGNRGRYGL